MERLRFLIGEWDIQPYLRSEDGEWVASPPNQTTITALYDGAFLQEHVAIWFGDRTYNMFIIWSYDKFRQVFRMVSGDDVDGLILVYEGNFEGDTLVVSNVKSGTSTVDPNGNEHFYRLLSTKTSEDSFTDELQLSSDGGKSWLSFYRAMHTRKRSATES
jgi:hypothetical protein